MTAPTFRSRWLHDKSAVVAQNGMVAARHPLAAEAGASVLADGGNAVDAAVAASLVNSVVQPVANTIGGGGLLVVHHPAHGDAFVDYRYEAPGRARADMFEPGEAPSEAALFGWSGVVDRANEHGHLAVATPGSIPGLLAAQRHWGHLTRQEVFEPAIRFARDGFPMDWYGTLMAAVDLELLRRHPLTARTFLRDAAYPYRPHVFAAADKLRQDALADTLQELSEGGVEAYYTGRFTSAITREFDGHGVLKAADVHEYQPRLGLPRSVQYGTHTVLGADNMSAWVPLLQVLAQLDLGSMEADNPRRLHLIAEALRLVRLEQMEYDGDMQQVDTRWAVRSSLDHARALAARIDPQRPLATAPTDTTKPGSEHTVHISAADADGVTVSLTETILGNFGSGITTDAGVLMNNGMFAFNPLPGHPNSIAPRKRPISNMTPIVVLDADGAAVLTLGASGGRRITAAVLQVLLLVLDQGRPLQEAISTPRMEVDGDVLVLDNRIDVAVVTELERMGHHVVRREETLSSFEFANPCGVRYLTDGRLEGGANPFQQTAAAGW